MKSYSELLDDESVDSDRLIRLEDSLVATGRLEPLRRETPPVERERYWQTVADAYQGSE